MSSDTKRHTRRTLSTALLLVGWIALSALVAACGNKESPQPPPRMIAATTRDLTVQQRGDEVLLSFSYPTVTVAGFTLGEIEAVEVWELEREIEQEMRDDFVEEEEPDPLAEETKPVRRTPDARLEQRIEVDPFTYEDEATLRATLRGDELTSSVVGEMIVTRLTLGEVDLLSETGYAFATRTISSRGLVSSYSNFATLVRRLTPPAPSPFEVTPGPLSIELRWGEQPEFPGVEGEFETGEADELGLEEDDEFASEEEDLEEDEPPLPQAPEITIGRREAPEPAVAAEGDEEGEEETERDDGVVGYRVYRRDAQVRDYGEPLRSLSPQATSFFDTTAVLGNRYIYAVTAVIETRPVVESALSVEHEVDYQDRFAPPAPTNVLALVERNAIRLLWEASRADDVLGYFISRAEDDGEFVQLNDEPIEVLEYVDSDVRPRVLYRYLVEGIDQLGNRGELGRETQAQLP